MKLKAFAKLNLSLRVFETRPDGFHEIESVMQSVSLCDYVTLTPTSSGIEVVCDDPTVPQGKANIAYKAAELFLRSQKEKLIADSRKVEKQISGIRIEIQKHIPMAAGLAGGSADAAAVLYGLNQLTIHDSRATNHELLDLAAEIGSDVPFCLTGGTCLVKGRGEIVEKQEPWPKTYFVLVCPGIAVSSKWAYEEFDRLQLNMSDQTKNDLEPAVIAKYPEIADIKEKLLKLGCSESQMSGSGSSVFGVVKHKADAQDVLMKIKSDYKTSFLIETVEGGVKAV